MRIVVTGALGHIGSRFIRALPESFPGCEVVMVDDLSTQRYCSLFDLPKTARYVFHEKDVLNEDLPALFRGAHAVVHLAAITDATNSFQNKDRVEAVNFEGTQRVAKACATTGCPMIFISTTSVYGMQTEVVDESCPESALKPQSPYAESKLRAERMLAELAAGQGLRFVTCRCGTIFGVSPGMRFHTAINKFCWQAVMGIPITVWRTALHQKRPYLDLEDAVRAFAFILKKDLFDARVYNVVTVNTTVQEIVDAIRVHIPDLRVEMVDTRIMNQLSYVVLADRFREQGFESRGDLRHGIAKTLQLLR